MCKKAHGGQTRQRAQKSAQNRQEARHAGREQSHRTRAHQREVPHTAAGRRQRRPNNNGKQPQAGNKAATHRRKKRRSTGHKSRRNSGQPRKNGQPGTWRGAPDAEKNLRTGKIRVRSFACPEGLVNRGRQKFASLFLTGTAFFCFALRTMRRKAQNKRGRRPLSSPASFLKKA